MELGVAFIQKEGPCLRKTWGSGREVLYPGVGIMVWRYNLHANFG